MTVADLKLAFDTRDLIRQWAERRERSLQTELGPSGLGTTCTRQLAYMAHEVPAQRIAWDDPWPSSMGVWGHDGVAAARRLDNELRVERGLPIRWLIEEHAPVPGLPKGHSDCYDLETDTAVDDKFPGASRYPGYVKNGPDAEYRVQIHTYGFGFLLKGYDVQRVAIMFYPRAKSSMPQGPHVWSEPLDLDLVDQHLTRLDTARKLPPEAIPFLPADFSRCRLCDYRKLGRGAVTDATGCTGNDDPYSD